MSMSSLEERLCELLRHYENFSNPSMRLYSDEQAKDNIWKEISQNLNTDTDIKETLRKIWDRYVRNLKRVKEMWSGAAAGVCSTDCQTTGLASCSCETLSDRHQYARYGPSYQHATHRPGTPVLPALQLHQPPPHLPDPGRGRQLRILWTLTLCSGWMS
ncbi:hypothetical protein J4Q44_G00203480 [Coregonus suidteri]|uniref:MADF domain-containing protein n=1 Tax=Coregonus suidteri TaxID=861788 RepID=A0AAN8QMD7_9TELE